MKKNLARLLPFFNYEEISWVRHFWDINHEDWVLIALCDAQKTLDKVKEKIDSSAPYLTLDRASYPNLFMLKDKLEVHLEKEPKPTEGTPVFELRK